MAVVRRPGRARFTLVLLVLTSITLLTLDYRGFAPLDSARSGVLSVFSPVGDAASGLFSPVGDAWNGAFDHGDLRAQNEDLRRQINDLLSKETQNEASKQELEQLKQSLNLPFAGQLATVHARVVSGSIANFDATIEIEKGTSSGIEKGMPVVAGSGLIGQVLRTSDGRAVVRLITDSNFQVGVNVANGAGRGVIQGQGDENRLRAGQFDVTADVGPDNILVTSGAARSLFPPGIPVGTVRSVHTDETTQQKVADVKPTADLNDLTYVTVLIYHPPAE